MGHDSQFCQLWIAWIAEGGSFQARWSDAPSNGERHICLAYRRAASELPDVAQYVRQMERDVPVTQDDREGPIAGPDRVLIRSIGPGDTFCSVSYRCTCPPDGGKALRVFLRYSRGGRLACVAIPNPRFVGLVLESSSDEKIVTVSVDTIAGARAESFFTGTLESNAHMEDVLRAIVSMRSQ
jgi:hypothetical protein